MLGLITPNVSPVKFQTIRNKWKQCCGTMHADATCWAQQCRVLLANNVRCVRLHGPSVLIDKGQNSPAAVYLLKKLLDIIVRVHFSKCLTVLVWN